MTYEIEHSTNWFLISICIPQYNRIKFLLYSLHEISKQSYAHVEIVISDDCSVDTTEAEIQALIPTYKYPIKYYRHHTNRGYDRNLRYAIEKASGQYVFVLGNDDTINPNYDLSRLVEFITSNQFPDVGFTNFEEAESRVISTRAKTTAVLGSGPDTAFKYYSCFSFVAGIIFKKSMFDKFNNEKSDGSIYSQIYLSSLMIANGARLFSISESVVVKDVLPAEQHRNSYQDVIARSWKDYKKVNGGLPSVIHVLIGAFQDSGRINQHIVYQIFKRVYTTTFPYWIVNYRQHGAFPEAVGLVQGMWPWLLADVEKLSRIDKARIFLQYCTSSIAGLLTPMVVYRYYVKRIYKK